MRRHWMCGLALLVGLGCDDGDGGSADQGTVESLDMRLPGDDMRPPINDCSGAFVVNTVSVDPGSVDPACAAVEPGQRVALSAGRLRLGDVNLEVTAADDVCLVEAAACDVDLGLGDRAAHLAVLDVAGEILTLTTQKAEAFRSVACPPITLALAPVGACALDGAYEVAAPLTLTAGMCDLEWQAEPIFIDTQSEAPTLRWGDDSYTITEVDPGACTVVAQTEFSIFNGVVRTSRIEARVSGEVIEFTVEDALDDVSDFGETCVAARFTGSGAHPPARPPQPAQCAPLPFVCGDGVCGGDAGENCENCVEDCGCAAGFCARMSDPVTDAEVHLCTDGCGPNRACGDAQQCVPFEEFQPTFVDGGPDGFRICLDSLPDQIGLGGDCTDSRACAKGLMCAMNILPGGRCLPPIDTIDPADCREVWALNFQIDVCHPRCDLDTDACGETSTCASLGGAGQCSTDDRERFYCHPGPLTYECRPDALGFGEPCASRGYCAQTGDDIAGCVGDQCTLNDERRIECTASVCSRLCESDEDCAAPLSLCSPVETQNGPSARKWCRSP